MLSFEIRSKKRNKTRGSTPLIADMYSNRGSPPELSCKEILSIVEGSIGLSVKEEGGLYEN